MKDEFTEYLKKLYRQYQASLGIQKVDYQKMKNNALFCAWLKDLEQQIKIYRKTLFEHKISQSDIKLELEKGVFDTIASTSSPVTLLTNYSRTFDNQFKDLDSRRIVKGKLKEGPYGVVAITLKNNPITICINSNLNYSDTSYVVSENPYNPEKTIRDLMFCQENGLNTCLGMFGKIKDHDRTQKLEILDNYATINDGIRVDKTIEGTYVSFVKTKAR